ncbi:hypothetical protein DEU56DRAFT_888775 [Suillus clintonianus]|uniref:uncharacterized protein n=1 Tax=Suillus clintonianus TaxID=1904413 RepID=UPI001B85B38F|nr:uncharacterized protein DEU56DRAFT_888775 [Suillus clintonianus]KAG2133699.1 hypothetical protein DEU56DRAFT_888775 [Suillus clintonianus]
MRHHSQELFDLPQGSKSNPRRPVRSPSPRAIQRRGPDRPSNSQRPKSGPGDQTLADDLWDPWPDGDFERLFTWVEVTRTANLSEHWACQPGGGDKRGSESALTWPQGKKTRRVCLGVITCDEPTCEVVTRPRTRRAGIMAQLSVPCLCGGQLTHNDCGVTSVLHSFKEGVYYIHKGVHNHPKQTHVLHLTRDERTRFEQIVFENPTTGPAALVAGRHSLSGTRESVATISTVLLNQDRVKAELQALRGKSTRNFVDDFAEFQRNHPGYVLYSQFEVVTVVVVQTQFMVSQLVTDFIEAEAVNGIVSDAAHGFWHSPKDLLIISSTYSPLLACWVPGLMTYANGGSAEHYRLHFLILFNSMADECEKYGHEVNDELFGNVVDFSEAERVGFTQAFITFWTNREDSRSLAELEDAAGALLKGCQQHYRSQVTRVKKISGVIDPSKADNFQSRALALLSVSDMDTFKQKVTSLLRDYPKLKPWLEWWLRDSHAQMLFPPFQKMKTGLFQAMPNSTNAEEAMHAKLYATVGKRYHLMEGLLCLQVFMESFQLRAAGRSVGAPIRYGTAKTWQNNLQIHGRTHPERAPLSQRSKSRKNDGRPPDTSRQLLRTRSKSRGKQQVWKENLDSCSDSSLDSNISNHPLSSRPSYACIDQPSNASRILTTQRDGFRKNLKATHIVKDTSGPDGVFGWLGRVFKLLLHDMPPEETYLARTFFEAQTIDLRFCSGPSGGPTHWQIPRRPHPKCHFQFNIELSVQYKGDLAAWFRDLVRVNKEPTSKTYCWRTLDAEVLCHGSPNFLTLYLGIPVMLIVEFGDVLHHGNKWNIPKHIRPLTKEAEEKHLLVYDVVGLAFCDRTSNLAHFVARYSPDGKRVYHYDDLSHGGFAQLMKNATLKSHLVGNLHDIPAPAGFNVHGVVYRLRGGSTAQDFFAEYQIAAAERLHHVHVERDMQSSKSIPTISFSWPGVSAVDPDNLIWLKNPATTQNVEYEESLPDPLENSLDLQASGDEEAAVPKIEKSLDLDDGESEASDYTFHCRCGAQGNGHDVAGGQKTIQCDLCENWSHIACQRGGRASNLHPKAKFHCDGCSTQQSKEVPPTRNSRKATSKKKMALLPTRLIAGKGALARLGKYWYPVRLIQSYVAANLHGTARNRVHWRVVWWRGCKFPSSLGSPPGDVEQGDLVDELWQDHAKRREIRLGEWVHSWDTPREEDLIQNFMSAPASKELDNILRPHIASLQKLLDSPDLNERGAEAYPVIDYIMHSKKNLLDGVGAYSIPYCGDISSHEYAKIARWFSENIPGASSQVEKWLGGMALVHAFTLVVAHRKAGDFKKCLEAQNEQWNERALLKMAWADLLISYPADSFVADVDLECLTALEARMFEDSEEAGPAGNQQWGLDAGQHHRRWNVYLNVPSEWVSGREYSESELKVRKLEHYLLFLTRAINSMAACSAIIPTPRQKLKLQLLRCWLKKNLLP